MTNREKNVNDKQKKKVFSVEIGLIFIVRYENYHISPKATATMKYLFSYHWIKINIVFIEKNT
jgi:hypothetical protein